MSVSELPPTRRKTDQITQLLESRIVRGDYQTRTLPTERKLATELGVSRMTARKALQKLLQSDLLHRLPGGELVENRRNRDTLRVAVLVPTLSSRDLEMWRLGVDRASQQFGASPRTMLYIHWDDYIIDEALRSYDGIFLCPSCEPIPRLLIERLRNSERPVAILGRDFSADGVPSIELFPASVTQKPLDHLASLGHRAVDCFNVQTIDPVIDQRIAQWNVWRSSHGFGGRLLGEPIRAYGEPMQQAYEEARRLVAASMFQSSAVLCTTVPAALGLIRAFRDVGVRVGVDRSVCVINDEGLAPFVTPTITSVPMPDPTPYLATCLDWMKRRRGQGSDPRWIGPLLLQPSTVPLLIGESTGPVLPAS
jgi:DNA-binding LacI/PurR family transcriptional regulator